VAAAGLLAERPRFLGAITTTSTTPRRALDTVGIQQKSQHIHFIRWRIPSMESPRPFGFPSVALEECTAASPQAAVRSCASKPRGLGRLPRYRLYQ